MTQEINKKLFLHKGQSTVFNNPCRMKVVVAGRRWGKSKLAAISLIMSAATQAKSLNWYVSPTYRMCKGVMWPEVVDLIPKKWIIKSNETLQEIRLLNGSRIELKGADKPDSLRGVGLNYLIIDEAQDVKKEVWSTVLRPTLADKSGRALIIGTPKGFNWLYDVYMLGQDRSNVDSEQWSSWQFPTITSPFILPEEIEASRKDMDEKSFKQEFLADFTNMSGRVYHAFDRRVHVGSFKLDPCSPIWIGMDFNVNPMTAVIMQPKPNGTIWVVDEISMPNSCTDEMAHEIERRYWKQLRDITIYPDPAGSARSSQRGETDLDILQQKGFRRIKVHKKHVAVLDRVNSVNKMFKSADGRVRLFIDSKCKNTIASLEQTIFKEDTREIDKSNNKEHITDALGYAIEYENPVRQFISIGISY